VARGNKFETLDDAGEMDDLLVEEYSNQGSRFEECVRIANSQKQSLREEIVALETEMR
jgi:hypothetical protein